MTGPEGSSGPDWLAHGRIRLALHRLRDGTGPTLLVLHGLGEEAEAVPAQWVAGWPGPVHGLDFTGHGRSTVPAGGGYTVEVLMADADRALEHLGGATVLGRGLGAYVALLLAGARPDGVAGAILADGPGLAGGGPSPHSPSLGTTPANLGSVPDPFALAELAVDVRPADYASSFARHAVERSRLESPLCVAAVVRPPWLEVVAAAPGVFESPVLPALARYANVS
ncbi:MAG: alpha/beta fold hydrolase [Acidimicrobiales bacterium]